MDFLPRTLLYYMLSHAFLFWHGYRMAGRRAFFFITLPFFVCMGLFPFVYHLLPAGEAQTLFGKAGIRWLPLAFFLVIAFAITDILAICSYIARVFISGQREPSRKRYLILLFIVIGALYGYGVYEAHDLRVTRIAMPTEKLPAASTGLRIAFASDLHIGPHTGPDMLTATVDMILAQKPDIILLGGDIFDDSFQGTREDLAILSRLKARYGTFAVLGNHDAFGGHPRAAAKLSGTGITLLRDKAVDAGPIRIIGAEDPLVAQQNGSSREASIAALTPLLQNSPRGRFTILLDHRPFLWKDAVGLFDLQLSGHSHGGQIFPLKVLLEAAYRIPSGFHRHESPTGKSALFVTTGTGFSKLPIRLLVPPEIVVIDLEKHNASGGQGGFAPLDPPAPSYGR